MDPRINDLYSDYRNGRLERRRFLRKLALLAGGTAAAVNLLSILEQRQASAAVPAPIQDPGLNSEFITYRGASGEMRAYLSHPKTDQKLPAVVVIHENRGLVPHIMDVNRRMAREGFVALAPDALSPLGGTPEDQDEGRNMFGRLDRETTVRDFIAAVEYLKTHPLTTGKVGCTGFCWGGAMTNQVAVHATGLDAAVPYYGSQPDPGEVPEIEAPMMLHYAGEDERINQGIPAFEEALKKAGVEYEIYIYEGAQHAFNNDSNQERYDKEAAELAWKRTVQFFKTKLKD
ncbi:MAG: dienelactone hydrolase family protein [Bacteroidetes bacterium]|nr:MAG: dienelactone hydrolase family protein [Bacteroidota bacterium]